MLFGAGGASEAFAAKRVVVFKFEGRGSDDAQDEVGELVQRDATLVSQSALGRAQKRLGIRRISESAIARLAAELTADAFIEGSLEKKRRGGYTLLLTVHEGKTGAVTDTLAISMRSPRMDSDSKTELGEKLVPALAKIAMLSDEPIDITPTKPDEVDTEKAPISGGGGKPKPRPATGDEPPPSIEGGETPEETLVAGDEMTRHPYARHAAVDVQLGVSAVRRSLSFTYAPALTASQRPNGYNGSVVPSVMLTGEVYPLAFGKKSGAMSGIGIGFVVDRVLLLKSRLGMKEYSTSQMRLGAGLRYRWNFGNKPTLPTIKFIAGYSKLDFTVERGADDIDLPNVAYSYLDFGVAARLPLGTPRAAFYLDARYLAVLSTGEVEKTTFYGTGSTLGLDGDFGFELQFLGRVIMRVGGHYQRIAHDFDGNGAKSNGRDGNMSTQDVGGALDQYLSGYLTAGYLF